MYNLNTVFLKVFFCVQGDVLSPLVCNNSDSWTIILKISFAAECDKKQKIGNNKSDDSMVDVHLIIFQGATGSNILQWQGQLTQNRYM